jgi:fructose-bisphosphate aldolase class II
METPLHTHYSAILALEAAKGSSVPVSIHYDHGADFARTVALLRLGFSSIMFDGSVLPFEDNIRETKAIVRMCHAIGVTVEAELGRVGGVETKDGVDLRIYTDPAQAEEFVKETGVDCLAVAIGTVHGAYKEEPKLNFELLDEIHRRTKIPLVLHGGSGLSDSDFRRCIEKGVRKINVYHDIGQAGKFGFKGELERNDSLYVSLCLASKNSIKDEVIKKIRVFGSSGQL